MSGNAQSQIARLVVNLTRKGSIKVTAKPRPTKADVFMEIAEAVSSRATCSRRKVGACLVKDGHVISTGYNGSIPNGLHCTDVGCLMINGHCKRTIHAELNVILQCAKLGIAAQGADLFVTTAPCGECLKLLATAGINGIFYLDGDYKPEYSSEDLYGTPGDWYVQKFTYSPEHHLSRR